MRASSDTIAQLAAAMAKAQSELVNPAKSLTAVIERGATVAARKATNMRRCHPGSTSCARAFGKYELAVIQTTHVDRERSLVLLTTTIAHGSGEWISGLWPVCTIADIGHPKLMGQRLPTRAAIACSPWLAWRARMTSMRRISSRQNRWRSLAMDRIRSTIPATDHSRRWRRLPASRLMEIQCGQCRRRCCGLPRGNESLPAAGGGLREKLGPPLPHLRDQGIQAAIWPTSRMRTRCFAGRWRPTCPQQAR